MGEVTPSQRLVPCPDWPCNERCIWCGGNGWIAKSTLAIYETMKRGVRRDTDKDQEAVKP